MSIAESTFTVEVERKFLPTAYLSACLAGTAGHYDNSANRGTSGGVSNVLGFYRLLDQFIRDTYYDQQDLLSKKGIWIRRHTSHDMPMVEGLTHGADWEAKVRIGGDYTDSKFLELQGESNIRSLVKQHLPNQTVEGLSILADLMTQRQSWTVHEPFVEQSADRCDDEADHYLIVVDEVTTPGGEHDRLEFRHRVGEVELTRVVEGGADVATHMTTKQQAAAEIDIAVKGFMMRYKNLFPTSPRPQGKLSAYFDWKRGPSCRDRAGGR